VGHLAPASTGWTEKDKPLLPSALSPAGLRTEADRKTPKYQCRVTKPGDNGYPVELGAAPVAVLAPASPHLCQADSPRRHSPRYFVPTHRDLGPRMSMPAVHFPLRSPTVVVKHDERDAGSHH